MNDAEVPQQWWGVALAEEIGRERPLARRCLEERYVLFRDSDGVARALEDRCAHRRAPLSLGRVTGAGFVQCPYHGWSYDGATGACRAIPNLAADERVPPRYGVTPLAVVERGGFVFVWTGERETADPGRLPAFPVSGEPGWSGSRLLVGPHATIVEALLDAPGLVLAIDGVAIVDGYRYGEPVLDQGRVVSEFAARPPGRTGLVADYPMSVRIAAGIESGVVQVELRADDGEALSEAVLACTPASAAVTWIAWRGVRAVPLPGRKATLPRIGIVPQLDAAALLAVKPHGGLMWRAAARVSRSIAA